MHFSASVKRYHKDKSILKSLNTRSQSPLLAMPIQESVAVEEDWQVLYSDAFHLGLVCILGIILL